MIGIGRLTTYYAWINIEGAVFGVNVNWVILQWKYYVDIGKKNSVAYVGLLGLHFFKIKAIFSNFQEL